MRAELWGNQPEIGRVNGSAVQQGRARLQSL
jgi:hypothetical protein